MDANETLTDTFRATKRQRRPAVKVDPCTRPSRGPNASFISASTVRWRLPIPPSNPPKPRRVDKRVNRRRIRKRLSVDSLELDELFSKGAIDVMQLFDDYETRAFLLTLGDTAVNMELFDTLSASEGGVSLECDEELDEDAPAWDEADTLPRQRVDYRASCVSPFTLPTASNAPCTPLWLFSQVSDCHTGLREVRHPSSLLNPPTAFLVRHVARVAWSPPTNHAFRTTISGQPGRHAFSSFSISPPSNNKKRSITKRPCTEKLATPIVTPTNLFSRFYAANVDAQMNHYTTGVATFVSDLF